MGGFTFRALVVLLLLAVPLSAQTPGATRAAEKAVSSSNRTVFPASLAGRWTSTPLELALTSEFHRSVYGAGAVSVRSVTMTIQPSGDGVFTVRNRVRDQRGRVVAGTEEIEEVRFAIGDLVEQPGRQPHYASRVVGAERRFADDPRSAFAREGVRLAIYVPEGRPGTLEVRFDTPEGTGSFWETVRRTAARSGSTPRP